jgi:hypothetical protein
MQMGTFDDFMIDKAVKDSAATEKLHQQARISKQSLDAACDRIARLEAVLREIVREYDQTHDGEIHSDGSWTHAASIPVEVMERAQALLK